MQVIIDNVTYNVIQARNADEMEAAGYANTARVMREHGHRLDLVLQRPKGKKLYWALQYKSGVYCKPLTI